MANPQYLGVGHQRAAGVLPFGAYIHARLAPHNAQIPVSTAINVHVGTANESLLIQECFDDSSVGWMDDVLGGYSGGRGWLHQSQ
jgi:L-alanine-DL-glutamate epimerase-like enolase superfamily enzyme